MLLIYAHTSIHVYAEQRPLGHSIFWRGMGSWVRGVTGAPSPPPPSPTEAVPAFPALCHPFVFEGSMRERQ